VVITHIALPEYPLFAFERGGFDVLIATAHAAFSRELCSAMVTIADSAR
jgi:hypothetical protein